MNIPMGMTGPIGNMPVMGGMPMGMSGGMSGMPGVQTPVQKIKEQIEQSKTILIVTHEQPTFDSIGASLAMYLGLISLGKQVVVACPDSMRVELSNFIGANKVTDSIAKRNFVVSLDYKEGMIEKVSYNIEGDKFNLVVETREGFEPFSPDKVSYSMAGSAADLIISIDTIHLGGLKALYETQKELFAGKTIINVDRHPNNAHYGTINFFNAVACSTSELVAEILSGIGVKLTVDIATNLLNGIYGATNNFTITNVSPRAFEVAAVCTRAGGKRFLSAISGEPHGIVTELNISDNGNTIPANISTTAVSGIKEDISSTSRLSRQQANVIPETVSEKTQKESSLENGNIKKSIIDPMKPNFTVSPSIDQKQKEYTQKPIQSAEHVTQKSGGRTPDDWLKPKIFKSRDVN